MQISLKGNNDYCINNKVPIFYEYLLCKSTLNLQKSYESALEVLWIPYLFFLNISFMVKITNYGTFKVS